MKNRYEQMIKVLLCNVLVDNVNPYTLAQLLNKFKVLHH